MGILNYLMGLTGANDEVGKDRTIVQRLLNKPYEPKFLSPLADPAPQRAKEYVLTDGKLIPRQEGQINNVERVAPSPKPVQSGSVKGATNEDFAALLDLFAQKAVERGFHPAPLVSQFAAESERGQSRFARERNNYLGLGAYTSDPGKAIRFDSPEASMDYYLDLISKDPRYAKAFAVRQDPNAYLNELTRVPYATDPNYVNMITNTPEYRKYNSQAYNLSR